jgi:hypothetical protein
MDDKGELPLSKNKGGGQLRSFLYRQRLCVENATAVLDKLMQAEKQTNNFIPNSSFNGAVTDIILGEVMTLQGGGGLKIKHRRKLEVKVNF